MNKIRKVFILFLLILYTGSSPAMHQYKNRIAKGSVTNVTGLTHLIRQNRQQKRDMGFGFVVGPVVDKIGPIAVAIAKAAGFSGFAGLTVMGANSQKEAIQKKIDSEVKRREEQIAQEKSNIESMSPEGYEEIKNGKPFQQYPLSIGGDIAQKSHEEHERHLMKMEAEAEIRRQELAQMLADQAAKREAREKRNADGWWGGWFNGTPPKPPTPPAPPILTGQVNEQVSARDITPPMPPSTGCGDRNPIKLPTHTGHTNNPPIPGLDVKPGCGSTTPVNQPTHTGHTTPVPVVNINILDMARDPKSPLYAPGPPKADEIRDKDGGPPKHDWKPAKDYTGDIGTHTVPGRKDPVKGHQHEDRCVFTPTGEGTRLAHGGAHYDVQISTNCPQSNKDYENVYPGKPTKDANGKPINESKGSSSKGTSNRFDASSAINTAIDTSAASTSAAASASISTTSSAPAPTSGSSSMLGRLFWGAKQSAPVSTIVAPPAKQSGIPVKGSDAPVKQAPSVPEKKVESAPQQPTQPVGKVQEVKMADTMTLAKDKDGNTIVIDSKDCGNPNAAAVGKTLEANASHNAATAGMPIKSGAAYRTYPPGYKPPQAPGFFSGYTPSAPAPESDYDRQQRQMREGYNKWRNGGY